MLSNRHLGLVLNSEAASGAMTYGNFGEILGAAPTISANSNPHISAYAGYTYDTESGKYHTPNRLLDPGLGRWTTRDSIGFGGGDTNLYRYVGNNSIAYVDPYGQAKCTYSVGSGSLICTSNDGTEVIAGSAISGVKNNTNQDAPGGPIPIGTYEIRKVANSAYGTWFLDPGLIDRVLYKFKIARGGFNLHLPGSISEGCITVKKEDNKPKTITDINLLLERESGSNFLNVVK